MNSSRKFRAALVANDSENECGFLIDDRIVVYSQNKCEKPRRELMSIVYNIKAFVRRTHYDFFVTFLEDIDDTPITFRDALHILLRSDESVVLQKNNTSTSVEISSGIRRFFFTEHDLLLSIARTLISRNLPWTLPRVIIQDLEDVTGIHIEQIIVPSELTSSESEEALLILNKNNSSNGNSSARTTVEKELLLEALTNQAYMTYSGTSIYRS